MCDASTYTNQVTGSGFTVLIGFVIDGHHKLTFCEPCEPCGAAVAWDYEGDDKWSVQTPAGTTNGHGDADGLARITTGCDQVPGYFEGQYEGEDGQYHLGVRVDLYCICPGS